MTTANRVIIGGAFAAAGLIGGYYLLSPFITLSEMRSALISHNADKVSRLIDYSSVREDLKGQLIASTMRNMQNDPDLSQNPFAGLATVMVGPMINTMVDSYVTPAGMKTVMAMASGESSSEDRTSQNLAEGANNLNEALKKTSFAYDGLNTFRVTTTADNGSSMKLAFTRQGFADWKLTSFTLPE